MLTFLWSLFLTMLVIIAIWPWRDAIDLKLIWRALVSGGR